MRPTDVTKLLVLVASLDRRFSFRVDGMRPGDDEAVMTQEAWELVLEDVDGSKETGGWEDVKTAVRQHYTSEKYVQYRRSIEPGDVVVAVRQIRAARLDRAPEFDPKDHGLNPETSTVEEQRQALLEFRRRALAGSLPAPAAELPQRPVAKMLEAGQRGRALGRRPGR